MSPAPVMLRAPDKLTKGTVIRPIPGGRPEVVLHVNLVRGRWMVRTYTNLHRMSAELLVPVVAEYVDGLGFVTAEAVA